MGPSGAARKKIRDLELRAGHPARRGQRGAACVTLTTVRQRERRRSEQAEKAYERLVRGWNPRGPRARTGAAKEGASEAARQGSPRTLLFATQSPMRRSTIASTDQEKAYRSHLWCAACRAA